MRRGDVVTVVAPGDYGKPRPALVVQSDLFQDHPSTTVCLMTSDLRDTPLFRFTVPPKASNGLQKPSQVMVDKLVTLAPTRIGETIGRLGDHEMGEVTRLLALWLGLA
ncbi:transcriptional modulator of MazE/toxin, MazF [mine drainage metagenome]|uniref:Transcriptional modulator of MazE/toxin, MazF n=1 Tax=mine drainage metagenome TaxID=410659 RepID=T1ACC5_9ZZZZ